MPCSFDVIPLRRQIARDSGKMVVIAYTESPESKG